MQKSFYDVGISPFGPGFHAAPVPRNDPGFRKDPGAAQWLRWEEIFESAKRGNFDRTPELIDVYERGDPTLQGACRYLMAFAGSESCLERLHYRILEPPYLLPHIDFCQSLIMSGRLAYMPAAIETYVGLSQQGMGELEMIAVEVRRWLGNPGHELDDSHPVEDFARNAMSRYRELVDRFGSKQVSVFLGEKVAPELLARQLLSGDRLMFAPLRLVLEAFTGRNFSAVFADRAPRPLPAAALAEEFLDSGEGANYEPGVRYFWGHRISE